jgi:hypothetical protein
MADVTDYDDETLRGLLDVLRQLKALLGQMEGKQPLAVIAGRGRGGKKPRAKLSSVDG